MSTPRSVLHHFQSKRTLFAAAHELGFDPAELLSTVADLPQEQRGAAVARAYLSALLGPGSPALSLVRAAATEPDAARMLNEFVTSALLTHAEQIAPGPDASRRLALAGAQLVGIVFGRAILQLEPLVSADLDELIDTVAPVVQHYLDDPRQRARSPRRAPGRPAG